MSKKMRARAAYWEILQHEGWQEMADGAAQIIDIVWGAAERRQWELEYNQEHRPAPLVPPPPIEHQDWYLIDHETNGFISGPHTSAEAGKKRREWEAAHPDADVWIEARSRISPQ